MGKVVPLQISQHQTCKFRSNSKVDQCKLTSNISCVVGPGTCVTRDSTALHAMLSDGQKLHNLKLSVQTAETAVSAQHHWPAALPPSCMVAACCWPSLLAPPAQHTGHPYQLEMLLTRVCLMDKQHVFVTKTCTCATAVALSPMQTKEPTQVPQHVGA